MLFRESFILVTTPTTNHTSFIAFAFVLTFEICATDGIKTSLPKVIWEEGRVAAAVPGAGWHKGLRIRNVCIVLVKDRCAKVRYFSVRKQE